MPVTHFERVAEELRRTMAADPAYVVPPITELARTHKVSFVTMWKAVQLLNRQGVLLSRKGARTTRRDRPEHSGHGTQSPTDRLFERIKQGILDGRYAPGRPLPKFTYLVTTEHVSSITVADAMRRLSDARLIHKQGNRWFAGPIATGPSQRVFPSAKKDAPVVVMLCQHAYEWYEMNTSVYTLPFFSALNGELFNNGIELALVQREKPPEATESIPGGMDHVRRYVQSLGKRYRGALVCDSFPKQHSFDEWMGMLLGFSAKPAVYFDSTDVGQAYPRSALKLADSYFRLHCNEQAAVSLVLESLTKLGHKIIGVPIPVIKPGERVEIAGWASQRLELIRATAAALEPAPTILTIGQSEPFWDLGIDVWNLDRFTHFNTRIKAHLASQSDKTKAGTARPQSFQDQVRAAAPSMVSLLAQGATAIISINDWAAHDHYLWCRAAGFSLPKQLSLISFDNAPTAAVQPVTTVDFGFARLGYLAAHLLIGDISIPSDKEGSIPGICTLIDRGSVAVKTRGISVLSDGDMS